MISLLNITILIFNNPIITDQKNKYYETAIKTRNRSNFSNVPCRTFTRYSFTLKTKQNEIQR